MEMLEPPACHWTFPVFTWSSCKWCLMPGGYPQGRQWAVQVHRAVLHSGEQVVVKVQRPGLQKLFDIDLKPLQRLAQQLDAQEEGRDFSGIYQEYASILRKEIDYISEGRNANRCAPAPLTTWRHAF